MTAARAPEATLVDLLDAASRRDPNGVYARFEGVEITYAELARRSRALAGALTARGLRKGDRVAVMMRNSAAAVATIFALARGGFVWAPVNALLRGEGLRHLLSHCEPSLLIADEALVAPIEEAGGGATPRIAHGVGGELDALLSGPEAFVGPAPQVDDVFAMMYTSGTTGPAKGAVVSHLMLRLAGEAVMLVSDARAGDVFFVWEALYHIGGAQLLALPMSHGVRLAMVERFSASRFWLRAKAEGATHIHHLGGILQLLLKQPPSPLDRAHGVRVAWGGGCPADLWRPFEKRFGVSIRECYGMTEASSITAYNDRGVVGAVGRPTPWFTVRLLDAQGRDAAPGERGEIVVRTTIPGAIFPGYFRNPEATARTLRDGALHTGDLGSFTADGDLVFHGRLGDSVRCRGENVSAFEVERVAADHPDVEDCAMIGVRADIGEQDIKLFVKRRPGATLDAAALSDWLGARLAPYQNPRYIAFVDAFERTASQRIVKRHLDVGLDGVWDRSRGERTTP